MAFSYSPKIVTDGLVLYLDAANSFSYVSGSLNWNDLSRSQISGSLINGPTFSSVNNGSIVFDGTNDYIDCGTLSLGSAATLNIWFKQTTPANNKGLIALGNTHFYLYPGGLPLGLTVYSGAPLYQYGPGLEVSSSSTVWTMATFIVNSTNISIFCNGGSKTTGTNTIQTSGSLKLGIYPTLGGPFNGNIGLTQIYNRVLTDVEVLQNYNAQKSRFGLT